MITITATCDACGDSEPMPDTEALPHGWLRAGAVAHGSHFCADCAGTILSASEAAVKRIRAERATLDAAEGSDRWT
jgi:hypothetical protein